MYNSVKRLYGGNPLESMRVETISQKLKQGTITANSGHVIAHCIDCNGYFFIEVNTDLKNQAPFHQWHNGTSQLSHQKIVKVHKNRRVPPYLTTSAKILNILRKKPRLNVRGIIRESGLSSRTVVKALPKLLSYGFVTQQSVDGMKCYSVNQKGIDRNFNAIYPNSQIKLSEFRKKKKD